MKTDKGSLGVPASDGVGEMQIYFTGPEQEPEFYPENAVTAAEEALYEAHGSNENACAQNDTAWD